MSKILILLFFAAIVAAVVVGGSTAALLMLIAVVLLIGACICLIVEKRKAKKAPAPEPDPAPAEPAPKPAPRKETHRVAGMEYYTDNIESLGVENDAYDLGKRELVESGLTDERVYQYTFASIPALIPEPDNEHDKNAIRVEADGVKIGYIKAGSAAHIRKLLAADAIQRMDIDIYGGRYKYVYGDEDDGYEMDEEQTDYAAKLTLTLKDE